MDVNREDLLILRLLEALGRGLGCRRPRLCKFVLPISQQELPGVLDAKGSGGDELLQLMGAYWIVARQGDPEREPIGAVRKEDNFLKRVLQAALNAEHVRIIKGDARADPFRVWSAREGVVATQEYGCIAKDIEAQLIMDMPVHVANKLAIVHEPETHLQFGARECSELAHER